MSDTPRTQAAWETWIANGCAQRLKQESEKLERELAAVTKERDDWKRVAEGMDAFMERARAKTANTREGLECLREFDALKAKEAR
jgi:hypothetical protein